eukprot:Em0001g2471a
MNNIFLRRAVCNAANIRKERCKRCDFGICSSCCKCVKPKGRPWKILRDIEPIRVNVARNARPSLEFLSLEDEIPDYDFVEPVITEVEQLVTVPSDAGSISPRGGTMHVADREDSDDSDGDGENALLALNASELAVRSIALSIANCRGTTTSVKARMLMAQMSDLTSNYVEGEGGRKVSTAKQLAVALSSKCVKDTTVLLVKPKHDAPFVSTKVPAIQGTEKAISRVRSRYKHRSRSISKQQINKKELGHKDNMALKEICAIYPRLLATRDFSVSGQATAKISSTIVLGKPTYSSFEGNLFPGWAHSCKNLNLQLSNRVEEFIAQCWREGEAKIAEGRKTKYLQKLYSTVYQYKFLLLHKYVQYTKTLVKTRISYLRNAVGQR